MGIVAAGCANQAPTHPAPSFPAGPIATVMPAGQAPPVAPTTSPAQPDVIANIPAAARMRTGPGAEAFVRYFFDVLNEDATAPRGGRIFQLSTPACKTCAGWNTIMDDLHGKGHHYSGPAARLQAVNGLDGQPATDDLYPVAARWAEGESAIVDRSGRVVEQTGLEVSTSIIRLKWVGDGWRADSIKFLQGSKS